MSFILLSGRGPLGYIKPRSLTDCAPESLQRIAQFLSSSGYTTDICEAILHSPTPSPGPGALSTITGWLLTWWRIERGSLVVSGRLWVVRGVVPVTPFTSE